MAYNRPSSFRVKQYPIPFHAREAVTNELKDMLAKGIVQHSTSPYTSPLTVVKKKDDSLRLCVDFRRLNAVAEFDAEPIPNQEEIMSRLSKAKIFSKFDLTKGYWQIPLDPESKKFTAFQSPLGLLEFNYMPFGLAAASSTFQRLMRNVLKDVPNVISYFDDILVYSETWEEHVNALTQTLTALGAAGLTIRPTKSKIGSSQMEFLGHIVGHGSQKPSPDKITKIHNLAVPKSKKDIKKLCGLISYYRKFVPHFADIARPLTNLTSKGTPNKIEWTPECANSFQAIKRALTSDPILALREKEWKLRKFSS